MIDLQQRLAGRYQLEALLGEGGMGAVYRATDLRLTATVAVKFIRLDVLDQGMAAEILGRFRREAQVLSNLSHPHILKIIDFGVVGETPYLVTDFVPGGTLADRLEPARSWSEAARLLAPVARALAYAHGQGVVHRDLKPANILLSEDGQPIVADFGIAKLLPAAGEQAPTAMSVRGMGIGTPAYMSPEQARGETLDGRSDVYALGVILYELLTGYRPFGGEDAWEVMQAHTLAAPLPPRQLNRSIPAAAERVILRALEKDPARRFSMDELARILSAAAGVYVRAARPFGLPAWTGRAVGCLVGSILVAAAGGLMAVYRPTLPALPVFQATETPSDLHPLPTPPPPLTAAPAVATLEPVAASTLALPALTVAFLHHGGTYTGSVEIAATHLESGQTLTATVPTDAVIDLGQVPVGTWRITGQDPVLFVEPRTAALRSGSRHNVVLDTYDPVPIASIEPDAEGVLTIAWAPYVPVGYRTLRQTARCEVWRDGVRLGSESAASDGTTCAVDLSQVSDPVVSLDHLDVRVQITGSSAANGPTNLLAVAEVEVIWP